MALTFTFIKNNAYRTYKLANGPKLAVVAITIGATADYSTTGGSEGLDVRGNKALLGMSLIHAALGISVRTSAGDHRHLIAQWDENTGKIRFFTDNAVAGATPFTEIVPATHLAAGDIVHCVVIGE